MNDVPQAWAILGLNPTTDQAEVRRAYARALKAIDPARDPQAFQALRDALETVTAGLQAQPAPDEAGLEQEASAFVDQLRALRRAGDIQGATALVDRLFAEQRPGSRLVEIIGLMLFQTMALEVSLSSELFRHLVERFDWRDATGPAAQADPERHSVLLARVAAEDWYESLAASAKAGNVVATAALAPPSGQAKPPALDDAGKQEATAVMGRLMEWDRFLLQRFDARSLAALREAVEGPPLVAGIVESKAPRRTSPRLATSVVRRLGLSGVAALALVVIGLGVSVVQSSAWFKGPPPTGPQQARSVLDETQSSWVALRPFGGSVLVYFSQLVECAAALKAVQYGLDRDEPDQDFPLPPGQGVWPRPIYPSTVVSVTAPASLHFVSVRLVYADGSTSAVHIYRMGGTP